jgi:peroxiredoxin
MAQLRQDYDRFVKNHTEIIVVGPEGEAQFRKYWQEHDLPFIGLPNPDHSVLKRFGQEVNIFKLGRMPAQVIIDQQGIARYVHYGKSMSDIPDNDELIDIIQQINKDSASGSD